MSDLPKFLVMAFYDYTEAYSPATVRKADVQISALTTACENNEVFFQIMSQFPPESDEYMSGRVHAKYILQMALRVNKLFESKE